MRPTISILGLHNYTEGDIWDNLTVPEGIDEDIVIASILTECAELELLYSEPEYVKGLIGLWSEAESLIWAKLYETTQLEYNPLWNKDALITETETKHNVRSRSELEDLDDSVDDSSDDTGHVVRASTGSDDETFSSEGSSSRAQTNDGDQTTQVSAYDSSSFNNREKVLTTADATEHVVADNENITERSDNRDESEANDRHSERRTDRQSNRDRDEDEATSDDRFYEHRETGNIGITSSQQLIREQRDVVQFNIYEYITNSFKRRFCLLVY